MKRRMNKKVIVTGGTSFIGIALIELLQCREYDIVVIIRPNSTRKDLLMRKFPKIRVVECALEDLDKAILPQKKYDVLFHIGWTSDFPDSRFNIEGQMQNVRYCGYAVRLAAKYECQAFLCIGSQAECGVVWHPINSLTRDNPMTAYAEAKCRAYDWTRKLCLEYGIKQYWPRLLSAYGLYDRSTTMIMSCILACREKRTIELTPAEQIWDYIYVKDAAKALLAIVDSGVPGKKYSIASGEGRPLGEYIAGIAEIMEYPQLCNGVGKKAYAENQVMYLVGDIEELIMDTHFNLDYRFEEGIHEIIKSGAMPEK